MINIPSYVNDPNYRYQMPALQTKVEGSGNGIKTNILNLPAVAKSLRIPPEYPLKFFGHELCTNTDLIVNKKTGDIKMIINGSFTTQRIIQLLDKFIEKYVLCPRCKLPESFIQVTKKNLIRSNCNACGKREYLDSTHKAANYIIKNPPKNMHEFAKTVQIVENPKEIIQKDIETLEALSLQSPEVQTSIARLSEMVETQQPYTKVYEEMRNLKLSQAYDEDLKYFIIFKVLFGNELPQRCTNKYLLQILDECNDYKYSYKSLLIAMAHYFKNNTAQIKFVGTVFKIFLDNEIFSENILLKWEDSKVKFKKNAFYNKSQMDDLQINAKDFLQWLKEAEEEDEDEEEENKQNEQEKNQNGNSQQEEQKIEISTDNIQLQQKMLINQQIEEQKKQIEMEKQKLLELQQQKQEQQKQSGNSEDKMDLLAAKKEMDEEEIDINDI